MFAFYADDTFFGFGKICDMPKPVRLRFKERAKPRGEADFDPSKPPEVKTHYIGEWMEHRGIKVPDMVEALDTSPSQVYRWLKGQKPQDDTFLQIAALLEADPPEALLRHPLDDWMTKFFRDRSAEEAKAIKELLERAYPPKTGTGG
jgi:transcriptional regulator with XRE-family HTH domain